MTKERRTVSVDPPVDEYLAREGVNASELIERLVREHMKVGDVQAVALEVQKRQKQREAETVRENLERLEKDIEELDTLQKELQKETSEELNEHLEQLEGTPPDPTNPAIMHHAKQLDLTPQELTRELEQHRNNDP